jgi:hypothetical protein
MSSSRWLRISSIIALLFAAGHTIGGFQNWSPMGENPVLDAMRSVHFDTMGANRSYLDFYRGFGYALSISQLLIAVLLWQLASLAQQHASAVRPMILAIVVSNIAGTVIAWTFIFPIPALFALVLVATLLMAYWKAGAPPTTPA